LYSVHGLYRRERLDASFLVACVSFKQTLKAETSRLKFKEPGPYKMTLKVVTSEKIGGSGVTSTLGTRYGGVVMGVLLYFNEAAILYRDFNSAPSQKQNIIVFAANNSRCCECYVAPTIIL
jgi:hypothetical protein